MNNGQVAIEWHENESVNAGISRHKNQILDDFTPDVTEGPKGKSIVGRRERNAEDDE